MHRRISLVIGACVLFSLSTSAVSVPTRAQKGIVASQNEIASKIGAGVPYEPGEPLKQPDLARTLEDRDTRAGRLLRGLKRRSRSKRSCWRTADSSRGKI